MTSSKMTATIHSEDIFLVLFHTEADIIPPPPRIFLRWLVRLECGRGWNYEAYTFVYSPKKIKVTTCETERLKGIQCSWACTYCIVLWLRLLILKIQFFCLTLCPFFVTIKQLDTRGMLCVGNGWHFWTPVLIDQSHIYIHDAQATS